MDAISNIYRPAALFLTNKENYVADNGDFAGTQINSSNMLWSLSGNISLIHKIIFGIEYREEKLVFHPCIPKSFKGKHSLNNFKYRNAVLNIEVEGYGNKIVKFIVDGKVQNNPEFLAELSGNHFIKMVMSGVDFPEQKINKVKNISSPATPIVKYTSHKLSWKKVDNAISYIIIKNGKQSAKTSQTNFTVTTDTYAEYQVIALDKKNVQSFACEPVIVANDEAIATYEIEKSKVPINIAQSGMYAIDFRYANGNGPINTENKCAIRTLRINDQFAGTIILPQRGKNERSNWGYSNSVIVHFEKGSQTITLGLEDHNENMNGEINQAMLDYLRISKIK